MLMLFQIKICSSFIVHVRSRFLKGKLFTFRYCIPEQCGNISVIHHLVTQASEAQAHHLVFKHSDSSAVNTVACRPS